MYGRLNVQRKGLPGYLPHILNTATPFIMPTPAYRIPFNSISDRITEKILDTPRNAICFNLLDQIRDDMFPTAAAWVEIRSHVRAQVWGNIGKEVVSFCRNYEY